jgi:hypothetical protein
MGNRSYASQLNIGRACRSSLTPSLSGGRCSLTLPVPRSAVAGGARVSLAHIRAAAGVPEIPGSRVVIDASRRIGPNDGVRRAPRTRREFGGVFAGSRRSGRARWGRRSRLLPPWEQRARLRGGRRSRSRSKTPRRRGDGALSRPALRQKLWPALAAGRSSRLGLLPFGCTRPHDALGARRSWGSDEESKGDRRCSQPQNERIAHVAPQCRTLDRAASAYREQGRFAKPHLPLRAPSPRTRPVA